MAQLESARHVFELGLWAGPALRPPARWSPRAASLPLRLGRQAPKLLGVESSPNRRQHGPSRTARATAVVGNRRTQGGHHSGVCGTAEDYRRFGAPKVSTEVRSVEWSPFGKARKTVWYR